MSATRRHRRKPLRPHLSAMLFASLISLSLGLTLMSERSHGQAPSPTSPKPTRERAMLKAHASSTRASPSQTIFPKSPASVHFNHNTHAGQACTSCHTQALTSTKPNDALAPSMSACIACHSDAKAKPELNQCSGCHISYQVNAVDAPAITTAEQWHAVRPAPMIPTKATARIKFSHAKHTAHLSGKDDKAVNASCLSCHTMDARGESSMPQASQCASCHQGTVASDTCVSCHLQAPSGRLETSWKTPGQLTPTKLLPDDHSADWIKRHGAVALAQADDCMSCHVEQTCASCHQARGAVPRSVHPPNFLTIHRVAARSQEANCTSCHSQQTFCASCHTRTLNITAQDYAPPTRRKFHPPGWLARGASQSHGLMAKRNIDECASCHQEQDCLSCHRGISPHPATYQLSCKRALEANPRPCVACHQDMQRLQTLCR